MVGNFDVQSISVLFSLAPW
uniref:Uncharacterized protein n=1 Tax=Arundo donax TaxID=35708 RepID=A0A0A8YSN6_ARUDO